MLLVAAGALGLFACRAPPLSADPQVIADTDAAFQELSAGNEKALLARLPDEVSKSPGQVRMLGVMRQILPAAKVKRYELIGWRTFAGTGGRQHTAVLRYPYDNGEHVTATALFVKPGKETAWKMASFNIRPSTPEDAASPVVPMSLGAGTR